MKTPFQTRFQRAQPQVHGLALGMTLSIGATFLSQGCPLLGNCPACGSCLPRLPLLALPFLADGAFMLAGRLLNRGAGRDSTEKPA